MTPKHSFAPIRQAVVPVIFGCDSQAAIDTARALAQEVLLVGVVRVPGRSALSAGAAQARELRAALRAWEGLKAVRVAARVHVAYDPWPDLAAVVERLAPDLLLLEMPCQLEALGVTAAEVLAAPPADVVLVRGPFTVGPGRALVPMRGGPHAELALRLGLSLYPGRLTALHLRPLGPAGDDAPFRGLEQVLQRLPGVQLEAALTSDPAARILDEAREYDLVVMGATAQPLRSHTSLGPVADRVLRECPAGVLVVKTRRPAPVSPHDATSGVQAISILVDKWFAENTFAADEFADLEHLLALKRAQGLTLSLALPALNEAATVGKVIRSLQRALVEAVPLLDEIVLIDSDSTDQTRAIAEGLGVPVFVHQQLLPRLGARGGKGEALWKSLLVTRGDIIAWIDTDIVNIHPRFVYGIVGPLLLDPRIQFVKGFYRRPLRVGDKVQAGGGGRVTELTARPLLNLFYPELSGVVQPLSGEYAGRRAALEHVPFFSGYGVETGLLIDVFELFGLEAVAQVDLLERIHHNQPLDALSKMSFAILQAVIRKLERRLARPLLEEVNKSMKLIRHDSGGYYLDVEEIVERERPPMIEIAEYRRRRPAARRRRGAA